MTDGVLLAAASRFLVAAAFLPAARRFLVAAALLAVARRFRVVAAFFVTPDAIANSFAARSALVRRTTCSFARRAEQARNHDTASCPTGKVRRAVWRDVTLLRHPWQLLFWAALLDHDVR